MTKAVLSTWSRMVRGLLPVCLLLLSWQSASGQRYFNLTAEQVRIDTLLPVFTYRQQLGPDWTDSVYTVSIKYPEFVKMSAADVARYQQISQQASLPELPVIKQMVGVDRKRGELHVSLVPLVFRDGAYQKLVSFMLDVKGEAKVSGTGSSRAAQRQAGNGSLTVSGDRYAAHSVLASGAWVKIRVASTGVHQLTSELVRQAGFQDINKVRVYGYGGARQPEVLTGDYLAATDDLKEVPTCMVNGRRLFYANGPVSWNENNDRVRNQYSSYGYYFLTESDSAALTLTADEFLARYYPLAEDYNSLYEVDDYAWYHGGRNLYDATPISAGGSRTFSVAAAGLGAEGQLHMTVSGSDATRVYVSVNGLLTDTLSIAASGAYELMRTASLSRRLSNLQANNEITISTNVGGGTVRLDYIALHSDEPAGAPSLEQTFASPVVVGRVENQDRHADTAVDMVILIPTSQKLLAQAERLKALHEQYDGLRVRIVTAGQLYNEFSSGTPDANAYRRYLKMLYDRAETEGDMPRYLLLLGDGAWDNRMLCDEWRGETPDDYLLCYESENSYSETDCYVTDDYFCLLDDGEGDNLLSNDLADVAVGRISARTSEEASYVVDKIASYLSNDNAGAWQNLLCFMGDDGNQNAHMIDADNVAKMVEAQHPTYQVKRIMWDAYTRVSSSTGNSYPDVERLIKKQMQQGALLMNYAGHGRADAISHEYVLRLADFENTSPRLPLWVTASCDIMPFDGQEENIGETAMFNKKGGAVAFFGTTRTVYQSFNYLMNRSFTAHVLSEAGDGRLLPMGEAARRAKNELVEMGVQTGYDSFGEPVYMKDPTANKLQYTLLGDPALRLAAPTRRVVVDSINGEAVKAGPNAVLKAGSTATVSGYIVGEDGQPDTGFDGLLTAIVRDAEEQVTCRLNDQVETDVPFVYVDRPNTLFSGSNNVRQGRFTFTFAIPKDISYADATGLMNLYAVDDGKRVEASGLFGQFVLGGGEDLGQNGKGPSIYCYLNSSSFNNGGNVNTTPYFYAQLNDEDGINAAGSGIGHDIQLIIDGNMAQTYQLNDYFQFDFGSYTSGNVGFSIPELSYGPHKLQFRAWDILNNSSTAELSFNVVKGLEPVFFDVECTRNPAHENTQFVILHDRIGSALDVVLDVYDISGRHLWSYAESGVAADTNYTVDWDLTVDGGRRLQTGVYLYRLRLSSDGSSYVSKAKKLIVITRQ